MRRFSLLFFSIVFLVSFIFFDLSMAFTSLSPEDIRKIYRDIKDIRGDFIQKAYLKDLNRTDTYRGSFFIKIPSKMRWIYRDAKDEIEVIIKGDDMILYQKRQKQAIRERFDRSLYGQTPVALLAGLGDIEDDFYIEERDGGLLLRPKRPMGGIVTLELKPSSGEFPIGSLIIIDRRSNRIEIRLKDVSTNTGVSDSFFEFKPPEGVKLQELR
jgi:outer membrane lipoprotein-sorting protein